MQNFSPLAAVVRYLNLYRQTAERLHGYTARSEQIGWAAPIYLADTDAQAVAEARPHIEALFNKYLTLPFEMLFPPGYLSPQSLKNMRAVKRPAIAGGTVTIDALMETGIFLCGSPDTVRRKLIESHRVAGLPEFPGGAAVRHPAARPDRAESAAVRRRGAAGAAGPERQGLCRHGECGG